MPVLVYSLLASPVSPIFGVEHDVLLLDCFPLPPFLQLLYSVHVFVFSLSRLFPFVHSPR